MKKKIFICILALVIAVGPGREKEASSFALAVAPALMMNVASALVMGGSMYYCWTHGGKEAWAKLVSATKDGVEVTRDWLINKIAEDHGLNIESSVITNDPSIATGSNFKYTRALTVGDTLEVSVYFSGANIDRTEYWTIVSAGEPYQPSLGDFRPQFQVYIPSMTWDNYNSDSITISQRVVANSSIYKCRHQKFTCSRSLSNPDGFNPLDYPEIFGPAYIYINAYKAIKTGAETILDWAMLDEAPSIDPEKDQVKRVPVQAATATGDKVLGEDGKYYPPPPGGVVTDPVEGLGAPTLDPSSVGSRTVVGEQGTAPVNTSLDNALGEAGVSEGSTITGVNTKANTITWVDAEGNSHVTAVDPAIAQALASTATAVDAATVEPPSEKTELDLGDAQDPGQIPVPTFDDVFEQPEKKEVGSVIDQLIELMPGSSLLSESGVESSGSPVFTIDIPGFDSVSIDFSVYEDSVSAVGDFLYAIVCIGSLIAVVRGGR